MPYSLQWPFQRPWTHAPFCWHFIFPLALDQLFSLTKTRDTNGSAVIPITISQVLLTQIRCRQKRSNTAATLCKVKTEPRMSQGQIKNTHRPLNFSWYIRLVPNVCTSLENGQYTWVLCIQATENPSCGTRFGENCKRSMPSSG